VLDRPEHLLLRLANAKRVKEGDRFVMTADVIQEGAPYRLTIPLRVSTEDGKTMQIPIEVSGASTPIRFEAPAAPVTFTLDPDGNLLIAGSKMSDEKSDPFSRPSPSESVGSPV